MAGIEVSRRADLARIIFKICGGFVGEFPRGDDWDREASEWIIKRQDFA